MTITIHYCLYMFHIVPIRVVFSQATYHVTEGEDSYAEITVEALEIPTRSFSVYVNTRDGSAKGEHHAIRSLWYKSISVYVHNYMIV